MYAIPGFHNDFFMLVPVDRRGRAAAVAPRPLGRRDGDGRGRGQVHRGPAPAVPADCRAANIRRRRIIEGCLIAGVPLLAMDLALFGFALPNLSDQATLLTNWSFPNLFGLVAGLGGGTHGVLRLCNVALVIIDRAADPPPTRLAVGRGLGHIRADPQPRLAGPVVRGVAAPAGGAEHEPEAAPGGARADRVPGADVHARDRHVPVRARPEPAQTPPPGTPRRCFSRSSRNSRLTSWLPVRC